MRLRVSLSEGLSSDGARDFMWWLPEESNLSIKEVTKLIIKQLSDEKYPTDNIELEMEGTTVSSQEQSTNILTNNDHIKLCLQSELTPTVYVSDDGTDYCSPVDSLSGESELSETSNQRKLFHPSSSNEEQVTQKVTKTKKQKKKKSNNNTIQQTSTISSTPIAIHSKKKKKKKKMNSSLNNKSMNESQDNNSDNDVTTKKTMKRSAFSDQSNSKRYQSEHPSSLGIPQSSYTGQPLSSDHLSSMILVAVTNLNNTLSQLTSELRLSRKSTMNGESVRYSKTGAD